MSNELSSASMSDTMKPGATTSSASVYIKTLAFHGGAKLSLTDNSIVVLVGPNNSGKSLSLKEIIEIIGNRNSQTKSIKSLDLQRVGDVDLLEKTLEPYKSRKDRKVYIRDDEFTNASES